MRRILLLSVALCALLVPAASAQQRTIALPDNFTPEGIASGKGDTFYAGSIMSAEIVRGSYETGQFPPNGDNSNPREDVVRVSANAKKDRDRK